jgi:hypothetical protein
MYTRGSIALQGFFYARAGMDVWTNEGAFLLNAHSNYSSISGPFCFKQHRVFCIDAGDLEQVVFNKRNRCYKAATGLTMASAKGFDFICFARQIVRRFLGL